MTPAVRDILFSGPPGWVLRGTVPADLDFDFANGRHWQRGVGFGADPSKFITCSRASTGYAQTREGVWLPFGSNVARVTNQGLLVEEARTNSNPNNSMQGAIPGLPTGGLPTGWISATSALGLNLSVLSIQTINGIDTITLELSGTPTGSGGVVAPQLVPNTIAATTGQIWTNSAFLQLSPGGTGLTNISGINLETNERSAGGPLRTESFPITLTNNLIRVAGTATMGASTTIVSARILITVTSGQPVDLIYTIGWPQLELGAFATSPIRTTSAAVTRAADVVTVAQPPALGQANTGYASGFPNGSTATQVLFEIDDGTTNNRVGGARGGGGPSFNAFGFWGSGGTNVSSQTTGWPISTTGKIAVVSAPSDKRAIFNGGSPSSLTLALPVGLNNIYIGTNASKTGFFDGYIREFGFWTGGAPQTTPFLQAITAS